MLKQEIEREYFNWICDIVCGYRYSPENLYDELLSYLHQVEFTWIISKDSNRAEDGIDLRRRFSYVHEIEDLSDLLDGPCSVLEMMVALAIRCEETIMDDPTIGDRTGQWFWKMIVNLGLGAMTDRHFDINYVDEVIDRFLSREYEPDGHGGLFTVRNCDHDLRDVEIWVQMLWYLDDIT